MAFADKERLKNILRCPKSGRRIRWVGKQGFALGSMRRVLLKDGAFVFPSADLPKDYDLPTYAASNPYQEPSLELIRDNVDGIVLDFGSGSPRFSFPNVCELDIRKYATTDVVIGGGLLPFKDGCFDAIISESVLEHVPDPFLYMSELFRTLRRGGKVVLDSAFMQPLHGFPHHYFNTSMQALELLFSKFSIERIFVGPHQHPWVALHWILNSLLAGMTLEEDRNSFMQQTVGELFKSLNTLQEGRNAVKGRNDPWEIARGLRTFNLDHRDELGPLIRIKEETEIELATGIEVIAKKPL